MENPLRLPALDPAMIEVRTGTIYPAQFAAVVKGRAKRALTKALGLTQFGVNVTELAPGAASALRHFHTHEDEFVFVLEGEVVLETDVSKQTLRAGQCAGFPANSGDGHRLINASAAKAVFLEVGTRDARDEAFYSDEDLRCSPNHYEKPVFTRKDGSPL